MRRISPLNRRRLPKPGGERDLRDRQVRFVEQLLREVHAPGQRHLDRRRAEMLQEQPPQVPRGDAEPIGEGIDAVAIERAFADQPQAARHHARRAGPGRRARRRFGPAAQARPEAGGLRGRGGRVVADVFVLRRSRRADRPAINARARDGDEELAVEARIARSPRPIADPAVQLHHRPSLADSRVRLVKNGPGQTATVGLPRRPAGRGTGNATIEDVQIAGARCCCSSRSPKPRRSSPIRRTSAATATSGTSRASRSRCSATPTSSAPTACRRS